MQSDQMTSIVDQSFKLIYHDSHRPGFPRFHVFLSKRATMRSDQILSAHAKLTKSDSTMSAPNNTDAADDTLSTEEEDSQTKTANTDQASGYSRYHLFDRRRHVALEGIYQRLARLHSRCGNERKGLSHEAPEGLCCVASRRGKRRKAHLVCFHTHSSSLVVPLTILSAFPR